MGIAAPKLGPEFHCRRTARLRAHGEPGGLLFGSFIGGRMADLWGRKGALCWHRHLRCLPAQHPWAPDYRTLLVIRFLCGLGLGGALPTSLTDRGGLGRPQ